MSGIAGDAKGKGDSGRQLQTHLFYETIHKRKLR